MQSAAAPTSVLSRQKPIPRRFSWGWLWVLPVLLALGLAWFSIMRPVQVLPRITLAPGYALTDQNGRLLTSEAMRGKIVLYSFAYAQCGAACAPTADLLRALQTRLPELGAEVPIEFVTIAIDEATPEKLAILAQTWGADTAVWHFASADANRLKWVVGGGFGLYFAPRPDGTYLLDQGYMLVDGAGILRAEYLRAAPDIELVMRDLRLLLQEAQHSEGPARYAYEAAHLFACYPR